jgi:hypothetical protein
VPDVAAMSPLVQNVLFGRLESARVAHANRRNLFPRAGFRDFSD